jgi:nitrite reductase/ring-hydroxylating ferredoxin subunit
MMMNDALTWVAAPDANALPVGEVMKIEAEGHVIALFHLEDGYFATQDVCTHAVASLADGYVDGDQVECPVHAGRFCIRTGAVESLPATKPLKTYPVRTDGGKVSVGIEATA